MHSELERGKQRIACQRGIVPSKRFWQTSGSLPDVPLSKLSVFSATYGRVEDFSGVGVANFVAETEPKRMRGSQQCGICSHARRAEIEAALTAGKRYRAIADAFGVSTAGLSRHKAHAPASDLPVAPKGQHKILADVDAAIRELRTLQSRAKRSKNAVELALKVSRELRSWFQLRVQLARSVATFSTSRERVEPTLTQEQLETVAQSILRKRIET
jgi:hypothetical protein